MFTATQALAPIEDGRANALRAGAQRALLFVIWLTPIFSIFEIVALFRGSLETQSEALTPVAIKLLRDAVWVTVIVFAFFRILMVKRLSLHMFLGAGLLFLTIYSAVVAALISPTLAACGLRWITPVFLTFFLIDLVDEPFLVRLLKVMSYLLVLQLGLQLAQFFLAPEWYGRNSLGFAARSPGMFLIPSTGAFFSVLALFLGQFYSKSRPQKVAIIMLAIVSVVLTASGTGYMMLLVLILLHVTGERWLKLGVPAIGILGLALFPVIMSLTGRGDDYVELSFGQRVEIFIEAVQQTSFLPEYFGLGTNSGVLLKGAFPDSLAALSVDSTYASIVINLGLFGFALFLAALVIWLGWIVVINKLELYSFTAIFLVFGAVTIIPECFPANLLFAALLAHYLTRYFRFRSPADSAAVPEAGQPLPSPSG